MTARSVEGRPLRAYTFGPATPPARVLVFGGIHGDEPGSVAAVEHLLGWLAGAPSEAADARVVVAPAVNPDGLAAGTKNNARGVDLNRNFAATSWRAEHEPGYFPGPAPLSEPASAWLAALVEAERPARIVSVHQPFACVNYDGPARALAEAMSAACGWPVVADLGYPTPGSFGACYGVDRGIPVITLELPRPATGDDLARALGALRVAVTF